MQTVLSTEPARISDRLFSFDSPKAIKSRGYDWLNGILYLAPHESAGLGNLCGGASKGCIALCLGPHSGRGTMHNTQRARVIKTRAFVRERLRFMREVARQIAKAARYARKHELELCIRLNGATDILWEGVAIDLDELTAEAIRRFGLPCEAKRYRNLMELFPSVQFDDYTKLAKRFNKPLPSNYDLTFSRHEDNDAQALELLARGINVAVVFDEIPSEWCGFPVINGDLHDLRHLDPKGVVVGLVPKGAKAKRDTSGFVVRYGSAPSDLAKLQAQSVLHGSNSAEAETVRALIAQKLAAERAA